MAEGNEPVDDQNTDVTEPTNEPTNDAPPADDRVAYSTYDKAMKTVNKRGEKIDALEAELAEFRKAQKENDKKIDPTKYQDSLERENEELRGKVTDWKTKYESDMAQRDQLDLDRTKLSAVWDEGRKQGMVDDRDLLNFVDKDVIQVDEQGVVNPKSVLTVINKLKAAKPYFFQEAKPEPINDKAPDGSDDTDISTLSFSEQLRRKRNL